MAQKTLSGTFGDLLPEAEYKVKPSAEAVLASMENLKMFWDFWIREQQQEQYTTDLYLCPILL